MYQLLVSEVVTYVRVESLLRTTYYILHKNWKKSNLVTLSMHLKCQRLREVTPKSYVYIKTKTTFLKFLSNSYFNLKVYCLNSEHLRKYEISVT